MSQDVSIQDPVVAAKPVAIRLVPDTLYRTASTALGWTDGIPDLDVTILRADSAETPVATVHTDPHGRAELAPLVPGQYIVDARRLLNDGEKRAAVQDRLEAYVVKRAIRLGQFDTATVMLYGSRRGSLVTSEWFFYPGYYGQFGYEVGGFIEIYNNSDTTAYVDGLTIAHGFQLSGEPAGSGYCDLYAKTFIDPNGVWAWSFDWFPGRGRDYPVAPGKTVVVATDAIDHRPLFQNAIDLRGADFEFIGAADVDNPAVPNMISAGLNEPRNGHGENFGNTNSVVVLAQHIDVSNLPRRLNQFGTAELRRVPVAALIDVIAFVPFNEYGFPRCPRIVDPSIVTDVPNIFAEGSDPFLVSLNRRVLYTRSDGRKVLQNTRSSESDLVLGPRTPGVIP